MQKPNLFQKVSSSSVIYQNLSFSFSRLILFAIVLLAKIAFGEKVQAQNPSGTKQETQVRNLEGKIWGIPPKSESENSEKVKHDFPQVMPVYKNGGEAGMNKFITENLKPLKEPVNGLVFCSIVVGTNGRVSNPEILKGLSPEADLEALRIVKLLEFKPGKNFEQFVPVRMIVKVKFDQK